MDTSDSNNMIELNNFSEYGPKQASGEFGSLDSSDTLLSCTTHPFPSQGSLAGLELLAAHGSMAPNGSIQNLRSVYVNPLGAGRARRRSGANTSPHCSPRRPRHMLAGRSRSSELQDTELAQQTRATVTARKSQVSKPTLCYNRLTPGCWSFS